MTPTLLLLALAAEAGTVTLHEGAVTTRRFEIIDANLARGVVAARQEYLAEREGEGEPPPTCSYAGMGAENLGVLLYLVHLGEQPRVERWTVYRSPEPGDEGCTSDAEARAALEAAKAAIADAGLDPNQRLPLLPPTDANPAPRGIERPERLERRFDLPGGPLYVNMTHASDDGFHTYSLTASRGGASLFTHEHSPNPGMAGSGDLEPLGLLVQGDRGLLVVEQSWGTAARWDTWVFSPVLSLP